jgi:hypothetical protein
MFLSRVSGRKYRPISTTVDGIMRRNQLKTASSLSRVDDATPLGGLK